MKSCIFSRELGWSLPIYSESFVTTVVTALLYSCVVRRFSLGSSWYLE